jgi:hypothetical protein
MAKMHAATWNDESLLAYEYLGSAEWMQNKNSNFFHEAVNWSKNHYLSKIMNLPDKKVLYETNPFVMSLLEAQVERLEWKDYLKEL